MWAVWNLAGVSPWKTSCIQSPAQDREGKMVKGVISVQRLPRKSQDSGGGPAVLGICSVGSWEELDTAGESTGKPEAVRTAVSVTLRGQYLLLSSCFPNFAQFRLLANTISEPYEDSGVHSSR